MEKNYFVHDSSFVDEGVIIGEGTKIWHFCHISKGSRIGKGCKFGQNVFVAADVRIGDHVKIQNNVSVYGGVTLEDYVFCGPSCVFTNILDPRSKYPQETADKYRTTLVKEGASIGANATIVCGHNIGRHAFVGAGSVVTKNIPDFALVYGNPAKIKGWMCECGEKLKPGTGKTKCSRCGKVYVRSKNTCKQV